MRLTKRVAVITGAASRHRQRSLAKPMSESGPKQEVVVRQVRGDMRTFARAFVQSTLTSSRTFQMRGMVIGECPSESRQLPVGF
jgi:hypothetical protein